MAKKTKEERDAETRERLRRNAERLRSAAAASNSGDVNAYISARLAEARAAALEKSRTRTMPAVPVGGVDDNKKKAAALRNDAWLVRYRLSLPSYRRGVYAPLDFNYSVDGANGPRYVDPERLRIATLRRASELEGEADLYEAGKKRANGASCIYTATDNYGNQYRVASNRAFEANDVANGFLRIPMSDVEPGDIVQSKAPGLNGVPGHGMILDSIDWYDGGLGVGRGDPTFNYSNGGDDENAIVRGGHYTDKDTFRDDNWFNAFRFVGTPADSLRWKNEYERINQRGTGGLLRRFDAGGDKDNDALARAIIERVNREEAARARAEGATMMGEQPLVEEHPLAAALLTRGAGQALGAATRGMTIGEIGSALARGINWFGEKAMPSALLRSPVWSGATSRALSAAAPYADAAALSYWSAQGANAARDAARRGDNLSAVAYGGLAALPVAMPLVMRGSQGMKNLGNKVDDAFRLSQEDVASVNPGVIADESHQDANIMNAKIKWGTKQKAKQDVVDLFVGGHEIASDSKSAKAWKSTFNKFVNDGLGKELEGDFKGITNYAQAMLNKIKYSELSAADKKKFDFVKNHPEFKTMMADESDIFDLIKASESELEHDFPGFKKHMLKGLSQDNLIEKYIKEHPSDQDYLYYQSNGVDIDNNVFKEGLTDGLEANYPGITKFVQENFGEAEPETFIDKLRAIKSNKALSNTDSQQEVIKLLESEKSKTLTDKEKNELADFINLSLGKWYSWDDLVQPTYPFVKTDNGYVVGDALKSSYPLSDYIKRHTQQKIRVRQSNRDAVNQIISKVHSGEDAPLDLAAKDIFGRDIILPEEYVASMRLPEYRAAFPNGAEYFWRGDNSPVLYNNNFNTGYESLFGGDFDMASGYNMGHFSGGATPVNSTEATMSPNMLLYAVPKGTILDLGKFFGADWRYLPELTSQGKSVQFKINSAYAGKKANAGYPSVLQKLEQEIADGNDWILQHPFWFDTPRLRTLNPDTVPAGFTFDEAKRFLNTDDFARYIKQSAGSSGFPFQGVMLRGIHDGALSGNAANEVIYNIVPGVGRMTPKLVSPNSTFLYRFDGKPLSMGGSIHIKPSHRGRLTELKARTGKTEAELYNDGNPEHKKMVVFARNARKWHADGGLLVDAPADIEYANKWDRISNARYKMANDALLRSGASKVDADRLARFLGAQSALEAGWVDDVSGHNYAGYMSNGKRMKFDNADDFWDYHLSNLDKKWPTWRNAQTIQEYYDTVNNTALGLTTKELFNEYNRKHRDNPAYIYAPDWDNENYLSRLQGIYNKYISKYVKPMFDAGGFIQKYGKDKILSIIEKMKQSK